MGRENIYKTLSVASVMPASLIEGVFDFLLLNRDYVVPDDKKTELFKTRFVNMSLISDMITHLQAAGKDKAYSLIKLPSKTVSLREAIDMTFIPIDILQMKEAVSLSSSKTLSMFPQIDNQLIINVSDITKANGEFSDVNQFHNRVIRDFLSRSFYASNASVWISPTVVRYVAKVYSMTIALQIAKLFGLSLDVQKLVQILFCAFFVGKMASPDTTKAFMQVHGSAIGFSNAQEVNQVLDMVKDVLDKDTPSTLEDIFKVIDHFDHDQLKTSTGSRLARPFLNMKFASLFPESHVSVISLEYPPYFVYLMILVLSGVRIGLSFPMKNMNLIREGREVFEPLVRSSSLYTSL